MKIVEQIKAEKIRTLCIREEWYTDGTNDDYCEMLDFANDEIPDVNVVEAIARNIAIHSHIEMNDTESIANIMYHIINDCVIRFVDYED